MDCEDLPLRVMFIGETAESSRKTCEQIKNTCDAWPFPELQFPFVIESSDDSQVFSVTEFPECSCQIVWLHQELKFFQEFTLYCSQSETSSDVIAQQRILNDIYNLANHIDVVVYCIDCSKSVDLQTAAASFYQNIFDTELRKPFIIVYNYIQELLLCSPQGAFVNTARKYLELHEALNTAFWNFSPDSDDVVEMCKGFKFSWPDMMGIMYSQCKFNYTWAKINDNKYRICEQDTLLAGVINGISVGYIETLITIIFNGLMVKYSGMNLNLRLRNFPYPEFS